MGKPGCYLWGDMDILQQLRQAREAAGISRAKLAVRAGLNKNSLARMDDPGWNPTAGTINSLRKVFSDMEAKMQQAGESPAPSGESAI